jgi:hypothetical protein
VRLCAMLPVGVRYVVELQKRNFMAYYHGSRYSQEAQKVTDHAKTGVFGREAGLMPSIPLPRGTSTWLKGCLARS